MFNQRLASAFVFMAVLQSPVKAELTEQKATTIDGLREAIGDYLLEAGNLKSHVDVTKLVRLSNGRLSEKTHHVECMVRDQVMKISRYGQGIVDGRKTWFDIRETLLFPSGDTAEWRHPGFPGQLSFGKESNDSTRIGFCAGQVGDPLSQLKKIYRIIGRQSAIIVREDSTTVAVRTAPEKNAGVGSPNTKNDYIEILFSKEFNGLPVSMTRFCESDDPDRTYRSGASIVLEYATTEDGIVPSVVRRNFELKDDVQGILATTWIIRTFELTKPSPDEMKVTVPVQVLATDVDSGRNITFSNKDEALGVLKRRFGEFIDVQTREAAMRTVAKSFVGQCPDLPAEYRQLLQQSPRTALGQPGRTHASLLMIHGLGISAVGAFWVLRRRRRR